MTKAKKKSDVIVESVHFNDSKQHVLKTLFDSDEAPELKSVGYVKLPGTRSFVSYVITSKGREILKIEVNEPNLRLIAEDEAKISFVNLFEEEEEK